MFCPECGSEYVPGIQNCDDCKIPLVKEPLNKEAGSRSEPEYVELVTVLVTTDMGELMIAKSLLEAEGIRYLAKGEGLQHLFGYGSIGAGYNLLVGPVQVQVAAEDAEDARALLREI